MEIEMFGKHYFVNKIVLCGIIFALVIGAGLLGYFLKQVYQPLNEPVIEKREPDAIDLKEEDTDVDEPVVEEIPEIKVYVVGSVNKPGVVTLKKGQLIDDAIKAAGGAKSDADLENINLAYELNDNTMLRIKPKAAAQSKTTSEGVNAAAAKASKSQPQAVNNSQADNSKANSSIDIINDSLGAVIEDDTPQSGENKQNSLVNINTATQAELETLPNVGPATAKAIIDYRNKNGQFKKLTDLMNITGIKQKTYDKIKDYICIE